MNRRPPNTSSLFLPLKKSLLEGEEEEEEEEADEEVDEEADEEEEEEDAEQRMEDAEQRVIIRFNLKHKSFFDESASNANN